MSHTTHASLVSEIDFAAHLLCQSARAGVRSVRARVNLHACVTRCADACACARVYVHTSVCIRMCMCVFIHKATCAVYVHMQRASCCPDCNNDQPAFPVPKLRKDWQNETPQHLPHGDLGDFSLESRVRNM